MALSLTATFDAATGARPDGACMADAEAPILAMESCPILPGEIQCSSVLVLRNPLIWAAQRKHAG